MSCNGKYADAGVRSTGNGRPNHGDFTVMNQRLKIVRFL